MDKNSIEETLLLSSTLEQKGNLKARVCEESKKIWRVATPGMISRLCSFGTVVVTQSFVGHISSVDLAGFALVQILIVRFVQGILMGMSSATETLCGQAYGAKQYHMMGIYLQRSWIINLITLTLLLPVFIFATPIFTMLGQEESVAKSTGVISLWFIPFICGLLFSLTMQMYLQAQQRNIIIAWLAASQFILNIVLSWVFLNVLNLGINGVMCSLCMSIWLVVCGEFVYIFGGWCPETWKGFSMAAMKDLLPVVKLSVSSGVMICLEFWYYSILVLLAGYMKNATVVVSAFSICINTSNWISMVPYGIMGGACVRVANELGRRDARAVKFSINVVTSTSAVIGLCFSIVCLVFGNKLGYLFTREEEVVESISNLRILLATTILLGSFYPVLSGVAIGAGLQTKVAIINLICFYVIGLPLGAMLGYGFNLQVQGIWIGMTGGVIAQVIALGLLTWRTNWDHEVLKTASRLKKWYLESLSDNKSPNDV